MNTQGWIRGIRSKNSSSIEYLYHVVLTLENEFEAELGGYETNGIDVMENHFVINLGKYYVKLPKNISKELQEQSPYSLDHYILEGLKRAGFKFDVNRSQYVQYCYNITTKEI